MFQSYDFIVGNITSQSIIGKHRLVAHPANMLQLSKVVVMLISPNTPFVVPNQAAMPAIVPVGAEIIMYRGVTRAVVIAKVIGTTAAPQITPTNSNIHPMLTPDAYNAVANDAENMEKKIKLACEINLSLLSWASGLMYGL
jgi:hypothetical protein